MTHRVYKKIISEDIEVEEKQTSRIRSRTLRNGTVVESFQISRYHHVVYLLDCGHSNHKSHATIRKKDGYCLCGRCTWPDVCEG